MIAKMAGYAFRLRSLSYGGQVGSNPPELRAKTTMLRISVSDGPFSSSTAVNCPRPLDEIGYPLSREKFATYRVGNGVDGTGSELISTHPGLHW
jgi:hypothetical protein